MGIASIFKNLLKKPKSDTSELMPRTDGIVAPNQMIVRPPVRRNEDLIQPAIPDTSAQMNLPLINPRPPQRPIPLPGNEILDRTLSSATENDVAPVNPAAKLRPRRPSEATLATINEIESSPAENKDKGFKSKLWDVAKNAGRNFLRGYAESGDLGAAAGAGIAGAGVQIADPSTDEKLKQKKKLAELYGIYERQTKTEGEQEKIRRQQTDVENIETDNERDRQKQLLAEKKYDLDVEKSLDKRDFDEWRMKNGDDKLSETQNYNKWRMAMGDKKQASDQEYRNWRREAQKADLALRSRGLDIQEKRNADNTRIQGEKLQLTREQRAEQTKQFMKRNNLSLQQLKSQLAEKVAKGTITQEQADEMIRDAQ